MQKFLSTLERFAPVVLRLGMTAVILWFSLQQFFHAGAWTAYVPDSAVAFSHLSATTLVYLNATFELVFGVMLAFGYYTRIVALLLALHLFDIMVVVGYGEIGVRDFGLALATLVVCMNGPDELSFHQKERPVPVQPVMPTQPPRMPRRMI